MAQHKTMARHKTTAVGSSAGGPATFIDGAEAWWSAAAECQREMMEFVADRLTKDGEAVRDALMCRNLTEALAVQSRWADQMRQDYAAEAAKMLAIGMRAANQRAQSARVSR